MCVSEEFYWPNGTIVQSASNHINALTFWWYRECETEDQFFTFYASDMLAINSMQHQTAAMICGLKYKEKNKGCYREIILTAQYTPICYNPKFL